MLVSKIKITTLRYILLIICALCLQYGKQSTQAQGDFFGAIFSHNNNFSSTGTIRKDVHSFRRLSIGWGFSFNGEQSMDYSSLEFSYTNFEILKEALLQAQSKAETFRQLNLELVQSIDLDKLPEIMSRVHYVNEDGDLMAGVCNG